MNTVQQPRGKIDAHPTFHLSNTILKNFPFVKQGALAPLLWITPTGCSSRLNSNVILGQL